MNPTYLPSRAVRPLQRAGEARRRVRLRHVLGGLVAALACSLVLPVQAQLQGAAATPVEGRDYQRLDPQEPVETPGKIEIIFFFGYWCPHCNEFEPGFSDWSKKQAADVIIRHIPIAFADAQVPLQRLYYVLDTLGKEAELRTKVFAAIHVDQNPLNTLELQTQFAQKNGIDPKKFADLYNSFSVQTRVRRASQMAQAYGVDGIPFVTVDGKYRLGEQRNVFVVLDSLVAGERKSLPAGKS
jgi:thiol:disulfide interchange protein DsbA